MKRLLGKVVKYLQFVIVFAIVASAGVLLGEKGLSQRQELEAKRTTLEKENERLSREIKSLERKVTLLRSHAPTIEKVAKRKLGVARTEDTVYIFDRTDRPVAGRVPLEDGLAKAVNQR